jgi:hypothetical protein
MQYNVAWSVGETMRVFVILQDVTWSTEWSVGLFSERTFTSLKYRGSRSHPLRFVFYRLNHF